MAAKLKKGDRVVLMVGPSRDRWERRENDNPDARDGKYFNETRKNERGLEGEIIEVRPKEGRAIVRGMNLATHHEKQTQQTQGGKIMREAPIPLSNLALVDPEQGGPTRVGFKILEDGRKVRFAKKSGAVIDE